MKFQKTLWIALCLCATVLPNISGSAEPLRALLITGGCCHDYEAQKEIISAGISARANVIWKVAHEGTNRNHTVSVYENADWAKGFDVVVHNECFGAITNAELIGRIVSAHTNGVPAVMLHCSMHSYREATTDEWRKLLGVSSYRHGARHVFEISSSTADHPVMKGFPDKWQNFPDELYQIVKVWPDCVPLGKAVSPKEKEQVCVWVNTYGKARVFGTTLGHQNETMQSEVYLDLITRGLLWTCDKLDADGKPKPGYGKVAAKVD
jgi:type 1 glutamine amidotransferase